MTDDLLTRLREADLYDYSDADKLCTEAADRIEELEKRVLQAKMVFATMRSEMSNVCVVMKAFEDEQ